MVTVYPYKIRWILYLLPVKHWDSILYGNQPVVFTLKTQTRLLSLPQQKVIYSIEIALTCMIHVAACIWATFRET